MNSKLSQMPFLRLVVPLIAGITLALYFPAKPVVVYIAILLVPVFLFIWNRFDSKHQGYAHRWIFGAITGLFFIAAGYTITVLKRPYRSASYYEHYLSHHSDSLVVSIISQPQLKGKDIKATGEITGIIKNGKSYATSGKAMFYFQDDSAAEQLKYGDELAVYTYLRYIKFPRNPDAFNYGNYLAMHGIYREAYVRSHTYAVTGKSTVPWLLTFTNNCRQKLINLLNDKIKGNEASVGAAILLGYRNDLSQSVIQRFADSGTIHVICVAGLHVGILFWLLGLLLLPLEKLKHGKLIRTVLLVLLLWLYALFTGMATPVVRATVMFSFLVAGRHFGRYTNSINTLAASAFVILLFNPFDVADAGFQLSYLSVLGIILTYPMLKNILTPRNFFIEKLWELSCLSVSAQLAIAPLSLLYFHQFPNYFVLTNLLVVPLLSVVIYAGILFFITAQIPVISIATTWLLQKALWLMNGIVGAAHHMPLFVSRGISISVPEALLLYLILISVLAFVFYKKHRALITALACFMLFLGVRIGKDYTRAHQHTFVVYDVPKHSAIAFLSGTKCITTQPIDSLNFCYDIQCHWWDVGIEDSASLGQDTDAILLSGQLYIHHNYAQFNHAQIAFIRDNMALPNIRNKVKVRYVVLSGNYKSTIAGLQNAFIFDKLIFDSSVSAYKVKKWEKECRQLHVKYYDVNTKGAFIVNT